MDHQQQTQQTEKIIVEMLEFLDSSSEEDNNDFEKITAENSNDEAEPIKKDINDNVIAELEKKCVKNKNISKKVPKTSSTIAKELMKLKQQFPIWNTKEIAPNKNKLSFLHKDPIIVDDTINCKTESENLVTDYANLDWQNKLETNCRRSSNNSYIQEIHKAIYQDTTGHPPSGSADYYQAAQNYVLYGKNFLDFPDNLQAVLNNKNAQNEIAAENTNLITNFGQYIYPKSNGATANVIGPTPGGLTSAYYQICNNMPTQTRPTLSNNPGNSIAYGIFLGNKVTYVAASPNTPSLIYNQHSATATNFISNSLANAALATTPTILYTNPMLTTTTQQYLNTFFKETQFLSTALTTANTTQSATVASAGGNGAGLYERLIYAQMLQQQLYQTQQAAAVAAMFQHKQRAAATIAAAARQSSNGLNVNGVTNSNRTSPQHLNTAVPTTISSSCNGSSLNSCSRQASSTSPTELLRIKPQATTALAATGNIESSKTVSD